MVTTQSLKLPNQVISYQLTYRNQRNLVLRFREGQIFLSAPWDCSMRMIQQFLYKNLTKILQYQLNYQSYKKISLDQPQWIMIFNQPRTLELSPAPIRSQITNDKIIIFNPGDQTALTKKLYQFLGNHYKKWFLDRAQQWAKLLNVEFKQLSLRAMVSKWGICYPEIQKIVFNIKLIHYDPQVIDYVIVHELIHLIHPNHSSNFWYEVQRYLPNYYALKNSLKL